MTTDKRGIFALQQMIMVSHPPRDEPDSTDGFEEERVSEGRGGS